jgi:hypothetical protein
MYYNDRAKMKRDANYLISWYISTGTIMPQVFASILKCNSKINIGPNMLIYISNFTCCSKRPNVVKCNLINDTWCIYEIL